MTRKHGGVELVPQPLPDEEKTLPFWEHVGELRDRLIRSALALFAATLAAYAFRFRLWELAKRPLMTSLPPGTDPFAYTDIAEPFFAMMRLSFWAAVFAASPFLFYQLWGFVRPALRPKEQTLAVLFVAVTSACFVAGALFAYFLAFPLLSELLLEEAIRAGLRANLRPDLYLNLLVTVTVGTGLCFEAPVLSYFLARFGLIRSSAMLRYWRESFVALLAVCALLTPGDVLAGTVMFGAVLFALYLVSAGVVWCVERSKRG